MLEDSIKGVYSYMIGISKDSGGCTYDRRLKDSSLRDSGYDGQ